MNFKVDDMIVFQPRDNIRDYFLNGVREGDTGIVTHVSDYTLIANMTTRSGEIVDCFYLSPEDCIVIQEEKLPPVEATLHIGKHGVKLLLDRSAYEDVYIGIGDIYKNGLLHAAEGIHLTVDEALDLAHDIKRMALAVQRGEL